MSSNRSYPQSAMCRCGHLRLDHRAEEPEDHEECGRCFCSDFVMSPLDRANAELQGSWKEVIAAIRATPPAGAFVRFADWLFTWGKGK